jgi:hypothetical protein
VQQTQEGDREPTPRLGRTKQNNSDAEYAENGVNNKFCDCNNRRRRCDRHGPRNTFACVFGGREISTVLAPRRNSGLRKLAYRKLFAYFRKLLCVSVRESGMRAPNRSMGRHWSTFMQLVCRALLKATIAIVSSIWSFLSCARF